MISLRIIYYPTVSILRLLLLVLAIGSWQTAQTQTFNYATDCQAHLPIPDNGCNTANPLAITFDVNDLPAGAILGTDIYVAEVRVTIEHGFTDDIEIRLTSPFGKTILLSGDNGSGQDNYGDPADATCATYTSFVPAACDNIQDAGAPFIGTFAPQESFAAILDGNAAAGNWTLSICDDVEDDEGFLEYAELIFATQDCLQPLDVEVTNIDSTTVDLDWFAAGFCENTLIEYGPEGFMPGTGLTAGGGTLVSADCPPYALQNLPENTSLDIYIRTDCGSTVSPNSCVVTATTLCALSPATLRETFDNQSLCAQDCNIACPLMGTWQNQTLDDFDWLVNTGATPTDLTGPSADADGDGNYLYIETSGTNCRNGREAILWTECIDVNTLGEPDCHFSFQYHAYGNNVDSLKLDISLDAGGSWTTLWSIFGDQGNQWNKQYIDLAAYDNQTARFRFVVKGGIGNRSDVALDNLVFYGSQLTGGTMATYYLDADGDGFGNPNIPLEVCAGLIPTGYVLDATDCNDANANINPDAAESPCNGIDENCNGVMDDLALLPPLVMDIEMCSGDTDTIFSTLQEGDFVFWYDAPEGGTIVFPDFGTGFAFTAPNNSTDAPITYTFYAEAKSGFNFNCASQPRAPASFIVQPDPDLQVAVQPQVCSGQMLDLASLNIFDNHNTDSDITFHTAFPPTAANQLMNTTVTLDDPTTYYILAESTTGCIDTDSVVIDIITGVDFGIQQGDSLDICFGGNDTLYLDFALPNVDYSIEWNTGDTTDFLPITSNAQLGFVDRYLVIVTNENGCESADFIYVTTVESIDSVATSTTDVSACSTTDGAIDVMPQSGVAPFHYQWSGAVSGSETNVNGNYTIQNLPTGTYSVTVTDSSPAACPRVVNNLVINQPIAEVQIATLRPVSCFNEEDGMIEISVQGTNPSIEWNTGAQTNMIAALKADTYSVSVIDNDCETVLDIVLTEPAVLQLNTEVENPRCFDSNDGQIVLGVLGGTAPFSYNWNNGATTSSLENITSGAYQVEVEDANNCQVASSMIMVAPPDTLKAQVDDIQQVNCNNEQNGRILLTTTGGTAPYSYDWSHGAMTEDVNGLESGIYNLEIRDADNCISQQSFTIDNPSLLTIENTIIENASCPGATDGAIRLAISGGTSINDTYLVSWLDQNTDTTALTNLTAGTYAVAILDDNNCRIDSTFTITAPDELVINTNLTQPHCAGAADGMIDLQLAQPPQSVLWSTGDTTSTLHDVADGFYTVAIVDAFGCNYDTSFTLQGRQLFDFQTFAKAPSCFGDNDGLINLNFIRGGRPPFNYDWNNGRTTQNINNLEAGDYVALITDVDGCAYQTDTFKLAEPTALDLMVMDSTSINCYGENSGSAEVAVSGGTGDYRYFWNDEEQSSPSLTDVEAGTYEFLVLDENDCTENMLLTFDEPDSLEIRAVVIAPDICDNPNQQVDSIQLQVRGGTPTYKYEWSTGDTIQHLTAVEIGDYEVKVTDVLGCKAELKNIKVGKIPAPFLVDTIAVENISCNGANDGSLSVTFTGGRAPYTYLWSPPLGGQTNVTDIGTLTTGNVLQASGTGYNVTITDMNNCRIVTDFVEVIEPPMITVQVDPSAIQDVRCFMGNDGSATVDVLSGTAPFDYQWVLKSTGEVADSVAQPQNLGAGTYEILVTDANGCQATNVPTVTITQPNTLPTIAEVDIQDVRCFAGNDGKITIDMEGGVAPYEYNWTNGETRPNLSNLSAGGYQLQVVDAAGCGFNSDTFFIHQPAMPLLISEIRVRDQSCVNIADGRIEQVAMGGTPPYTYFFDNIPAQQNFITQQAAGLHEITAVDINGCLTAIDTVEVRRPDPVAVDVEVVHASTSSSADGQIQLTPLSGVMPFSYEWSTGEMTDLVTDKLPGMYSVAIIDGNNCSSDTTAVVSFSSGIQEVGEKILEKVNLFPNPSSGKTQLTLEAATRNDFKIICYSLLGETLFTKQIANLSTATIDLPTENLTPGTYFISLTNDKHFLYFEKIIIVD